MAIIMQRINGIYAPHRVTARISRPGAKNLRCIAGILPAIMLCCMGAGPARSDGFVPAWGPYYKPAPGVSCLVEADRGQFVHFALVFGEHDEKSRSCYSSAKLQAVKCAPDFRYWETFHPAAVNTRVTYIRTASDQVAAIVVFKNTKTSPAIAFAAVAGGTLGTLVQTAKKHLDDFESGSKTWNEYGGVKYEPAPADAGGSCLMARFPAETRSTDWRSVQRAFRPDVETAENLELDLCGDGNTHSLRIELTGRDGPFDFDLTVDWDEWRHLKIPLADFHQTLYGSPGMVPIGGCTWEIPTDRPLPQHTQLCRLDTVRFRPMSPDAATLFFDNIRFDTQRQALLASGEVTPAGTGVLLRHTDMQGAIGCAAARIEGPWPFPAAKKTRMRAGILQAADFAAVLRDQALCERLFTDGRLELDSEGFWAIVQQDQIEIPPGESLAIGFVLGRSILPVATELVQALDAPLDAKILEIPDWPRGWPGCDDDWGRAMNATAAQAMLNLSFNPTRGELEPVPSASVYPSFYTWDSGFHALGLTVFHPTWSAKITERCLQTPRINYPTIPAMAWWTLYQRTGDRELLKNHFDRVMEIHAGWKLQDPDDDGLYRYGPGQINIQNGMDDAPMWPLADKAPILPPCSTIYAVRQAKILRLAARELGITNEQTIALSAAIETSENSLNQYMWNEKAGWYETLWEKDRQPVGILEYVTGAYPVFADIVPPERLKRICENLSDTEKYWSGHGIRSADRSGPYHNGDAGGYWRGTVWIPPSYLLWRGLLGVGEIDLAQRLALDIVGNWCGNHKESGGKCFELFHSRTGQGTGASDFSGLSAGILDLYAAYCVPGTVTAGFDTVLRDVKFDAKSDTIAFSAETPFRSGPTGFVAVMSVANTEYDINGVRLRSDERGALSFPLALAPGETRAIGISPAE